MPGATEAKRSVWGHDRPLMTRSSGLYPDAESFRPIQSAGAGR